MPELTEEQQARYEAWKAIQMERIQTVIDLKLAALRAKAEARRAAKAKARKKNKKSRAARRKNR